VASGDKVRPTLDQLRSAMKWWNSLGRVNPPEDVLKKVRDALGLRPGQGMGASDITRYWLAHVQPNEPQEPEAEESNP